MMSSALLDTNTVSDLMRDHHLVTARMSAHPDPVTTSVVVVGEIHYGLDRLPLGKKRSDLEARAQIIFASLRVEPITDQIGNAYGRLKASLVSRGLNLDDNDLWIAATAIVQGSTLITRDQMFAQVSGLQGACDASPLTPVTLTPPRSFSTPQLAPQSLLNRYNRRELNG
jgi:predicted nucleic acid-binding protein